MGIGDDVWNLGGVDGGVDGFFGAEADFNNIVTSDFLSFLDTYDLPPSTGDPCSSDSSAPDVGCFPSPAETTSFPVDEYKCGSFPTDEYKCGSLSTDEYKCESFPIDEYKCGAPFGLIGADDGLLDSFNLDLPLPDLECPEADLCVGADLCVDICQPVVGHCDFGRSSGSSDSGHHCSDSGNTSSDVEVKLEDKSCEEKSCGDSKPTPVNKRKAPEIDWRSIEDPAERRKQRRLQKNRITAARSRERKKAQWGDMESKIALLQADNEKLKAMLSSCLSENTRLKEQLASLSRGASPGMSTADTEPAVLAIFTLHFLCLMVAARMFFGGSPLVCGVMGGLLVVVLSMQSGQHKWWEERLLLLHHELVKQLVRLTACLVLLLQNCISRTREVKVKVEPGLDLTPLQDQPHRIQTWGHHARFLM